MGYQQKHFDLIMDIHTFFVKPVYTLNKKQGVDYVCNGDIDIDKKEMKRRIELMEKAYWEKHPTHFLETTRFNNKSMEVNRQFRGDGCLYGNPRPLKKRLQPFRLVLELNNDENRIEGIGLISNRCMLRGKQLAMRDVYENPLFNQNVYRGEYRLDRSFLEGYSETSLEIFKRLDQGCFHGFYHVKRGNSISKLPFIHILTIEKEFGVDLVDFIRSLLKKSYEK